MRTSFTRGTSTSRSPASVAQTAARTVTLNSASKAFNVAGLRCGVCVAQSAALRRQLWSLPAQRWTTFSTLGVRAALAAWTEPGESVADSAVSSTSAACAITSWVGSPPSCPAMRCTPPHASYLAWLDCRELGLSDSPAEFFLERARVALSPGSHFGAPGHGLRAAELRHVAGHSRPHPRPRDQGLSLMNRRLFHRVAVVLAACIVAACSATPSAATTRRARPARALFRCRALSTRAPSRIHIRVLIGRCPRKLRRSSMRRCSPARASRSTTASS